MSDTHRTENIAALGIADWLCLAAAPTFALMALVSLGGEGAMSCMGAPSPIAGMPAMYLLMSAFHLAPWLRIVSGRKARTGRD
ncbi:hypothetical protein [Mesorhizobium sp. B2-3-4]|uniref:hypothetical protein n=1 Tax=Mesorhizobium sp. B2-3-4 TaxID=2589959 RepID=UPI001FEE89C0|nr:hypothetical protein [Mesorhizobium sp. B2-3-4]